MGGQKRRTRGKGRACRTSTKTPCGAQRTSGQPASRDGIISQLNTLDLPGPPEAYLTGQVRNINAVTPQQVSETARKYVRPEAMTIVVVGDKKVIEPQLKKFQAERKKPL